jgi:hypothetical protein
MLYFRMSVKRLKTKIKHCHFIVKYKNERQGTQFLKTKASFINDKLVYETMRPYNEPLHLGQSVEFYMQNENKENYSL